MLNTSYFSMSSYSVFYLLASSLSLSLYSALSFSRLRLISISDWSKTLIGFWNEVCSLMRILSEISLLVIPFSCKASLTLRGELSIIATTSWAYWIPSLTFFASFFPAVGWNLLLSLPMEPCRSMVMSLRGEDWAPIVCWAWDAFSRSV